MSPAHEPVGLEHRDPDCTGTWRLAGPPETVVCDRCQASYTPTDEIRKQAIDENYAAVTLRRLEMEGRDAR